MNYPLTSTQDSKEEFVPEHLYKQTDIFTLGISVTFKTVEGSKSRAREEQRFLLV